MTAKSSSDCGCKQGQGKLPEHSTQLGLDELMIVNPAASGIGGLFEGSDGAMYQLQDASHEGEELGQFFLGDDGALYQVEGSNAPNRTEFEEGAVSSTGVGQDDQLKLSGYLLGTDGTLYQITK